jgi:hypothetical protein
MSDKAEPRFKVDLPIRVFGVDDDGHPFSRVVHALNISDHGARLAGLEEHLRPGDIIGVHFGDKSAHCNVIWVVTAGEMQKVEVGVKLVDGQPHPWLEEMQKHRAMGTLPICRVAPVMKDRRKFQRQRIFFEIEVRGSTGEGPPMRTRTADIAGSGCYIETILPLSVGTALMITFWLNSEKVRTTAIVRTCDSGMGMGIQFTGLDEATQRQLQRQVESIAVESAAIAPDAEISDVWIRH